MNKVMMIQSAEPREIIKAVISEEVPAIVSYMSHGKWHVAKVQFTDIGAEKFGAEVSPRGKPHPLNINIDQQVGISVKYGYGKFIFEATILNLEPASQSGSGGKIIFSIPDNIELVQRRSYFRVNVPKAMKVDIAMWHRSAEHGHHSCERNSCHGCLADISAGGLQIAVSAAQKPDFKEGQTVRLKFTPVPYETPLMLNAQIRNVLTTADGENICFGLQMIGLEASAEGRLVLQRLCNTVEQYYQMSQVGTGKENFGTTVPAPYSL